MDHLNDFASALAARRFLDEAAVVAELTEAQPLDQAARARVSKHAGEVVRHLRDVVDPGLMELFLAEYGLSTREGIALMTLAEAYLRTPDTDTLNALIKDKIGAGDWDTHQTSTGSQLMNASTWALMLTGRMLREQEMEQADISDALFSMIGRLGEPVIRKAVEQVMKMLGEQFVMGSDIGQALARAEDMEARGYRYSYDMLGEAARTMPDAKRYFDAYAAAIKAIGKDAKGKNWQDNPGISIKLSALHPRYETLQRTRVLSELVPRVLELTKQARTANIGISIDAEEADRLELSLEVIEAVLRQADLKDWSGFGIVVQAYSKQAPGVLDWLYQLAGALNGRIAVRLVKGAYWDTEIKHAQVLGVENYPVFTRKSHTDICYIHCAKKLLDMRGRVYPQFATHNAHTMAAVLELTEDTTGFEFQRLHGMGEQLHEVMRERHDIPCRIYAPVGIHKDLLAYLVRRLLENGANSSFVNQLLDKSVIIDRIVRDPVLSAGKVLPSSPELPLPPTLYGRIRKNSTGIDLHNPTELAELERSLAAFKTKKWVLSHARDADQITNPADTDDIVGAIRHASVASAKTAIAAAKKAFSGWNATPVDARAEILETTADLLEEHKAELIALAMREAGKTRLDGILEVREAVDFCRYYAAQAREIFRDAELTGVGPVACISPWNFPLAIFIGQVAAAIVCGNSVLAKPAEQTPLIARRAVDLLHQAGVPKTVLTLLPGPGATIGDALTGDKRIKGVCFTGSIETAQVIDRNLAEHGDARAFLIAETGGLNAMIVDSTALIEQAAQDILSSAFQSAGQRCSALRVLCVQKDIEAPLLKMLEGAIAELQIGNPDSLSTDIGPVIDQDAKQKIEDHCSAMAKKARVLYRADLPEDLSEAGHFVPPAVIRLNHLSELSQEVFGPVLHVLAFDAGEIDDIVDQINASGFGLTLGVQSRVDRFIDRICARAAVGNIYVNRNQIGAVVGVQPFGGRGLSGTGPKAGGPFYLKRFCSYREPPKEVSNEGAQYPVGALFQDGQDSDFPALFEKAQQAFIAWSHEPQRDAILSRFIGVLPSGLRSKCAGRLNEVSAALNVPDSFQGPTGELNAYSLQGRGVMLCLGGPSNDPGSLIEQAITALAAGNAVIIPMIGPPGGAAALKAAVTQAEFPKNLIIFTDEISRSCLHQPGLAAVVTSRGEPAYRIIRLELARRDGMRVALLTPDDGPENYITEKLVSTDTTAAGGNASLLAALS